MTNSLNQTDREKNLHSIFSTRHSVRSFDTEKVSLQTVKECIAVAATAPSGANMQPWSFVLVTSDELKSAVRERAEAIEKEFYDRKISTEWREKLAPLGTNWQKPFLTQAPCLICIFLQRYGIDPAGQKIKHYYPVESVGIATGFLIGALHQAGLATLPYTPAPGDFLCKLLNRPPNERMFAILPVGCPAPGDKPAAPAKKKESEYLTVL